MQDKTRIKEMRADIRALSGIRTTFAVFKQAKTFYALERAATVIDTYVFIFLKPNFNSFYLLLLVTTCASYRFVLSLLNPNTRRRSD
jgi:hypothetical protein